MSTELEVMNGALGKLGEETQISDPDAATPGRQLRVIRAVLPRIRDTILRTHPWLSALRRRTLSKLYTGSEDDWKYDAAFVLPAGWLRVWAVDTSFEWERGKAIERDASGASIGERDVIFCKTSAESLRVVLIERVGYEDLDAGIIEAITCQLASEIAGPLQADKAMRKALRDDAREALAMAVGMETSEFGNQEPEFESAWLAARDGFHYDGSGPPPGYSS